MSNTDVELAPGKAYLTGLADLDGMVEAATTAEEQVALGQRIVLLADVVVVRTALALGDLANRYAPAGEVGTNQYTSPGNIVSEGGDYTGVAAAAHKARFQRSEGRAEMLREFADNIGLAPETVRWYANVAAKFEPVRRRTATFSVSLEVLKALASAADPHDALEVLLAEHPDPTRRQAREFAAAGFDPRQAAATNTHQQFNPGIHTGSQLDDEIKAERAENEKLDRERVEHEARQQQREEVRLSETTTLILPPDTRKTAGGKAQFGNWLISDLVETAEELVGAWEALAPDDRIKAKVLRILEPITKENR